MQINCRLFANQEPGFYKIQLEFIDADITETIEIPGVNLGPESRFMAQQQPCTLQEMLDLLDNYQEKEIRAKLNASGMIDFGAFLYDSLFSQYQDNPIPGEGVDLRIISTCEHIHRIPWNLLAIGRDARFLRDADWQISLAREYRTEVIKLPALPSLLIFSPPEMDYGLTERENHIRQIREALSNEIRAYESKALLQVVDTRQELERILKRQHFDILYYYGHGEGDGSDSFLRIESKNKTASNTGTMSLMHLRNALSRAIGGPPALCYINACMSSSGGKMGAGLQLGQVCPAVVANRTEAWVNVAQRQGLDFLKHVLLAGHSPHEALHNTIIYGEEDAGDLSWATPILTRHYKHWQCERPPNLHHLNRQAKDWRTRLDRTQQSGLISEYIEAVVEGSVDTLCCLWGGGAKTGVDLLHDRVMHKVPDSADLISCQMNWSKMKPEEDYRDEIFRSGLLSAFQCMHHIQPESIEAIPRTLKNIALHAGTRRILFHLKLQTVKASQKDWARPENFAYFLGWWQRVVCPEFQRAGIAVIMTMGYEMERTDLLKKKYETHLKKLNDQQLMIRLLPPLEDITQDHMRDFIQIFKLPIPTGIIDTAVAKIHQAAEGDYQKSLDSLVNLYEHGVGVGAALQEDDDDDDEWY